MSRGIEREQPSSLSDTASPIHDNANVLGATPSQVLDGFREVGRFIASGFSATPEVRPLTGAQKVGYTGTARGSLSSVSSTSTTKSSSTRVSSLSSTSSVDDSTPFSPTTPKSPADGKKHRPRQILIVQDTGASPLISPNPDFTRQKTEKKIEWEQQRRLLEEGLGISVTSPESGSIAEDESGNIGLQATWKRTGILNSSITSSPSSDGSPTVVASSRSSSIPGSPKEESIDFNARIPASLSRKQANRTSTPLASAPVSAMSPSAWIPSSIGKKLEDTLSKGQKRASVILSDITLALTSPAPTTPTSVLQKRPEGSDASRPVVSTKKMDKMSPPPSPQLAPRASRRTGSDSDSSVERVSGFDKNVASLRSVTKSPSSRESSPEMVVSPSSGNGPNNGVQSGRYLQLPSDHESDWASDEWAW